MIVEEVLLCLNAPVSSQVLSIVCCSSQLDWCERVAAVVRNPRIPVSSYHVEYQNFAVGFCKGCTISMHLWDDLAILYSKQNTFLVFQCSAILGYLLGLLVARLSKKKVVVFQ